MTILSVVQASIAEATEKDTWQTPADLFARLNAEYGPFTLDAAANARNHRCADWFGPGSNRGVIDALTVPWQDYARRIFCNPPYSRWMVAAFVCQGWQAARYGGTQTTFLVPATTEVRWWHEFVYDVDRRRFRPGVEVEFIRRRVRYLRPDGTQAGAGGFGSVVVTFGAI